MAKIKEVTDDQFTKLLNDTLPILNTSQVDRLWEALRLDVRRRYFNQGLESGAKVADKKDVGIADAIRAKNWDHRPRVAAAKKKTAVAPTVTTTNKG